MSYQETGQRSQYDKLFPIGHRLSSESGLNVAIQSVDGSGVLVTQSRDTSEKYYSSDDGVVKVNVGGLTFRVFLESTSDNGVDRIAGDEGSLKLREGSLYIVVAYDSGVDIRCLGHRAHVSRAIAKLPHDLQNRPEGEKVLTCESGTCLLIFPPDEATGDIIQESVLRYAQRKHNEEGALGY